MRRAGRGRRGAGPAAGGLRHDEGGPRRRPRAAREGRQARGGLDGRRHPARRDARHPAAPARRPLQAALRPGDLAPHRSDPRRLGVRDHGGAGGPLRASGTRGRGPHYVFPAAHPLRGRALLASRPGAGGRPRRHLPRRGRAGGSRASPDRGGGVRPRRGQRGRGPGPDRPLGGRDARAPARPAARGPPPRRHREGGLPPQGRARGRLRRLGRAPLRAARLPGRGRGLPLAGRPHRRRARGELPEGPAHRLRRGHVDDRRDPGLRLLRREAGGGGGPGSRRSWRPSSRGSPGHLGGLGPETLDREWLEFHAQAFHPDTKGPADAGEFRFRQGGRPHFNGPDAVRALHEASGYKKKARLHAPGSAEAYAEFSGLVSGRDPDHAAGPAPHPRGRRPLPSRRSSPRRTCSGASWPRG